MNSIVDIKLERDAITGDAEAQYRLGECYFIGRGAPQNYAKAVKWYRKAAEQGHVKAQVAMGDYCYNRHIYATGVMDSFRAILPYNDHDKIEAVKWYRKAAEQNYAPAQCNLGSCYDHGDGVTWDKAEAVKWYRKAAEQNYAPAHYTLGCCYRDGNGVTKNLVEAYKWFLATRGREEDLRRIEEIPEVGRFLKAGDYVEAQYSLGKCYGEGRYREKDMVEAVKYYHIAAEQEHTGAQYCLGCCYRDGQGVTRNLVEAYKWFNLASTQRDAMTACENLATLMTADQIAEAQ